MVINELIKQRYNIGRESNFSFWRDSHGNEVDLLQTEATEQIAYEIKSGATYHKDYFKGLSYWANLSGAAASNRYVIYGGDRSIQTSDGKLVSWNDL